jgi:hypothetical protein
MPALSALAAVARRFRFRHLLCRRDRHPALDGRRDALDVRELCVQAEVEAVRPRRSSSSSIALITTLRTANPTRSILAACGLTRAVTAPMVGASACACISAGRTLCSTNLATFTTSLAAEARVCSILLSNALMFLSFSPFDRAGDAVLLVQ